MSKTAVVIGSGIGGIASAIRLRAQGYDVKVIEKNAYPGGKLTVISDSGFNFDAGPSLFTLPNLVQELFEVLGESPEQFVYQKMDVSCKYFFSDQSSLTFFSDKSELKKEIMEKFGSKAYLQIIDYLDKMKAWYNLTAPLFLERSLHRLQSYLSLQTLKGILGSVKLPLLKSMNKYNESSFDHPNLTQLFNRYATYNGSNPYVAPGLMCMIAHLEHNLGTYLPERGMHQITEDLVALAQRHGVVFQYNATVTQVLQQDHRVVGIRCQYDKGDTETIKADVVVSDIDIHPFYKRLLPEVTPPRHVVKEEPSSSALIFYWGINKSFPDLDLHNIFFSKDYKQEFEDIFKRQTVPQDPTVYVNITSKYIDGEAPEGMGNWFVMVNVPSDSGQDWDGLVTFTREKVLSRLKEALNEDIADHIVVEQILDPKSIEHKTSSRGGALYGTSSNDPLAAFLRHPNFHQKIKGLYFSGGSVHPGGGIPLCLLSAKIVSELISKDNEI